MLKDNLINAIKQKKELSDISNSLISDILNKYLKKHKIYLEALNKKDIKLIISSVRAELRLYSGRFQKSTKDKELLLKQNKIIELLKTHSSTSERLDFYPELKKIISSLNISSILDLASGLNPLALASSNIEYYAIDIKESEIFLINQFFKKHKIKGKAIVSDIRTLDKFPKADLCILFKILDILDNSYELAQKFLKNINCRYFLISFSTITLSGKRMKIPRRFWLERILNNLNFKFKIFSSNNEIFYLIEKSTQDNLER